MPYILFGILFVLLHNLLIEFNFYNPNCVFGDLYFDYYSKRDIFHNIILTLRMLHEEPLLGGFWFLKSLFWGNLIFYTLIRALKGRSIMTICALFMLSFAFKYYNIIIPYIWLFPTDIFAAFFISMGYIVKKRDVFLLCNSASVCVLCIVLLIVGNCFIPYSMSKCIWNYMPFYIIVALAGICILFRLSAIIAESRIQKVINLFKVFGENTISVLTWHFSCFKLLSIFLIGLYSLEFSALAEYPVINDLSKGGWWIMYSLFGLFLPILPKLIKYGNSKK